MNSNYHSVAQKIIDFATMMSAFLNQSRWGSMLKVGTNTINIRFFTSGDNSTKVYSLDVLELAFYLSDLVGTSIFLKLLIACNTSLLNFNVYAATSSPEM